MTRDLTYLGKIEKGPSLGRQMSKFALAGGAGTVVHYLILVALVDLCAVRAGMAAFVGAATGACIVYLLNRKFTFETSRRHRETFPRFVLMAMTGAVLNGGIVGTLSAAGLHFLFAQVAATVAVLMFNFIVSKLWIFR